MKTTLYYQLTCNNDHNKCFCIKIKENISKLLIYEYIEGHVFLVSDVLLNYHPISSGWIKDNIFLLSEKEFLYFDISSHEFIKLCTPKYKISNILYFSFSNTYIYSSIIDTDFIDFYKKQEHNIDIKIACYSIKEGNIIFEENVSRFEHDIILKYVEKYHFINKENIYDVYEGHTLKIVQHPLYCELYNDNRCLDCVFGSIDRAIFLGDKIIYTYSSLIDEPKIKILNLEFVDKQFLNMVKCNNMFVYYCIENRSNIYYYSICNNQKNRGVIVLLHEEPFGVFVNRFEPMSFLFSNAGYMVYLINISGSTEDDYEYSIRHYRKTIIEEYQSISEYIKVLSKKHKDIPVYLVGSYYGAYLAIVLLQKNMHLIRKAYAINAFTDIRYQYLFTNEKYRIEKYFPAIYSPEIRQINPVDLAYDRQLENRLLIINGYNNVNCPKEQVIQFSNISGCRLILQSTISHYKIDYEEIEQLYEIILGDME